VSSLSDETVAAFEAKLDETSRALSAVHTMLDERDAERIGDKLERLASQLMEVTAPPSIDAADARLGLSPAGAEDFAELAPHMQPPDGEG
jgi:hypothetical protein